MKKSHGHALPHWRFPPEHILRSGVTLESALEALPAYADWRDRDPGPAHPVGRRYAALPYLTKQGLRAAFPNGLLMPEVARSSAFENGSVEWVNTSGTTEERVTNLWYQSWWNASERASWRLHAAAAGCLDDGSHREAILASPLNVGPRSDASDLDMASRQVERFLFLNEKSTAAHWTPALMDRMLDEMARFQPVTLEANPTLLTRLMRHAVAMRREVYQPKVVILTYELPSRLHLRIIRQALRCPLISSYGSTETGYVFMECEAGRYHQNHAYCRVDFAPFKAACGGPHLGRVFVTPLGNPWHRLLRFDVGDLVRVSDEAACPCGRDTGIVLEAIEGRARDVFLAGNGGLVTVNRLDAALSDVPGLEIYKLTETGTGALMLQAEVRDRLPGPGFDDAVRRALAGLFEGDRRIEVEVMSFVPPEASGKHRLAIPMQPVNLDTLMEPGGPV